MDLEERKRNKQIRKMIKNHPGIEGRIERKLASSGAWILTVRAPLRKPTNFHERIPIPDAMKMAVMSRDRRKCRYCGKSVKHIGWEFDHVIPVSQGGPTTLNNLVLACMACNRSKGIQDWKPLPVSC